MYNNIISHKAQTQEIIPKIHRCHFTQIHIHTFTFWEQDISKGSSHAYAHVHIRVYLKGSFSLWHPSSCVLTVIRVYVSVYICTLVHERYVCMHVWMHEYFPSGTHPLAIWLLNVCIWMSLYAHENVDVYICTWVCKCLCMHIRI